VVKRSRGFIHAYNAQAVTLVAGIGTLFIGLLLG
jgi:hypothetical protein